MKKILVLLLVIVLSSCSSNTYTKSEVDNLIKEAIEAYKEEQNSLVSDFDLAVQNVVSDALESVFIVGTIDRENNLSSTGSGAIFYSDDEYYYGFSNAHVIENGTEFIVEFSDSKTYNAEFHAINFETDLAVIKISKSDLPYVRELKLADYEDIKIGEFVVAIGSPISYTYLNTVTFGVISSTNRRVMIADTDGDGVDDASMLMIQHDAAINSGNSGGPLLNLQGEVVGINTLKITTKDAENIGLAISPNYLNKVLFDLVEYQEYVKPKIGVYLNTKLIDVENYDYKGITISEIIDAGAAEKAGLKAKDVIVKFNDNTFSTFDELKDFLNFSRVGDSVTFTIVRDNDLKEIEVILE